MRDALTQLYNLIALTDPEDKPKILVRVELVGGMVQYHPPIDKESADISVQVSGEFSGEFLIDLLRSQNQFQNNQFTGY